MNLLRHQRKFKSEFERDQHFSKLIGKQDASAEVVCIKDRGSIINRTEQTFNNVDDKIIYEFETDINVSFHIWALYKTDPIIYIPNKWMKRINDIIEINAHFRYDISIEEPNWGDIKSGHRLLHFIDEDDMSLIKAKIICKNIAV